MGVFKDAWDAKKKAENSLQSAGRSIGKALNTKGASGLTPLESASTVVQAIAHIPAAMVSTPGLPQKKKKPY